MAEPMRDKRSRLQSADELMPACGPAALGSIAMA